MIHHACQTDSDPTDLHWSSARARPDRIGIGQLRSQTRHYLECVTRGSTLEIVRRGRLAARIEPPLVSHDRVTPVTIGALRISAGRLLDRVAAGDILEVHHNGQLLARITLPDNGSD